MDIKITPELLSRYAQGRCTPEECKMVEQWLENDTFPFGELDQPVGAGDPELREEIWKAVGASGGRRPVLRFWYIAASIALVSVLAGIGYNRFNVKPVATAVREKRIHAPQGKTMVLRFPDKSVVWLQGGSTIDYKEPFRPDARALTLVEGKALFEIKHDPAHPFTVTTADARIAVLGTRFVVVNEAKSVQVTLTKGKVRFLTAKNTAHLMAPGQELHYNRARSVVDRLAATDTSYATAWTRQELWFRDAPLSEVMVEIGRFYGVTFRAAGGVDLSRRMNGRFEKQPLTRVLRLLRLSTGYNFSLQNERVLIENAGL